MDNQILSVNNLCKSFGSIRAVNDISFTIGKGQVVGVLGPNGSGKTTTLSLLLSIKHPDSGSFQWFDGVTGPKANARIGSILEVPYFYPYLNLEKNLRITTHIKGANPKEIDRVLRVVGLHDRSHTPYYTLSLGMKQRLAIANALINNPEVLVLDEPTNGLDPVGIAEVRQIIRDQVSLGKTIIMASHILDEVEKVCTNLIILKGGSVLSKGSVKELLSEKQQVTLKAPSTDELYTSLTEHRGVTIVRRESESITVSLSEDINPSTLNQWLMSRGIILSGLEVHKNTLESQFLELMKPSN